jgi:hypothetical protein
MSRRLRTSADVSAKIGQLNKTYRNALVPWLSSKQFNVMDDVGSIPIWGSVGYARVTFRGEMEPEGI